MCALTSRSASLPAALNRPATCWASPPDVIAHGLQVMLNFVDGAAALSNSFEAEERSSLAIKSSWVDDEGLPKQRPAAT
jgi:hypothetical protein